MKYLLGWQGNCAKREKLLNKSLFSQLERIFSGLKKKSPSFCEKRKRIGPAFKDLCTLNSVKDKSRSGVIRAMFSLLIEFDFNFSFSLLVRLGYGTGDILEV